MICVACKQVYDVQNVVYIISCINHFTYYVVATVSMSLQRKTIHYLEYFFSSLGTFFMPCNTVNYEAW